jgi:hypothetical protein
MSRATSSRKPEYLKYPSMPRLPTRLMPRKKLRRARRCVSEMPYATRKSTIVDPTISPTKYQGVG